MGRVLSGRGGQLSVPGPPGTVGSTQLAEGPCGEPGAGSLDVRVLSSLTEAARPPHMKAPLCAPAAGSAPGWRSQASEQVWMVLLLENVPTGTLNTFLLSWRYQRMMLRSASSCIWRRRGKVTLSRH